MVRDTFDQGNFPVFTTFETVKESVILDNAQPGDLSTMYFTSIEGALTA